RDGEGEPRGVDRDDPGGGRKPDAPIAGQRAGGLPGAGASLVAHAVAVAEASRLDPRGAPRGPQQLLPAGTEDTLAHGGEPEAAGGVLDDPEHGAGGEAMAAVHAQEAAAVENLDPLPVGRHPQPAFAVDEERVER